MDLLWQDFVHFGYPHAIVSDNASNFTSEEFKDWCRQQGIAHLTGAPYHLATFKKALKKSKLSPRQALQEFLIM